MLGTNRARIAQEAVGLNLPKGLEKGDCFRLVERILESTQFRNAPRLSELLVFLTHETLEGRADQIHEQVIGCNVFQRKPGYNSNEDNIVRVQARQLRVKLAAYFSERGANETFVLTIPKGSYVPVFSPRSETGVEASESDTHEMAMAYSPLRGLVSSTKWFVLAIGTLVLLAIMISWWLPLHDSEQLPTKSLVSAASHPLFAQMFDSSHPTRVVVADSSLELLLAISGHTLSLSDYLRQEYNSLYQGISPDLRSAMEVVERRQATSIADSIIAASFLQLSGERGPRVSIKFARHLQLRDVKAGHVILLGSKRSNPWVELFEPSMNFSIQYEGGQVVYNRFPQPGEQAYYRDHITQASVVGYGIVAFLPNLSRNGNVLIVAGTTMSATEAAGEFIANPVRTATFLKNLLEPAARGAGDGRAGGGPPYFEVLLETTATGGMAKESNIVAYRTVRP